MILYNFVGAVASHRTCLTSSKIAMIHHNFTCFHTISHFFNCRFKLKPYTWIKWYFVLLCIIVYKYSIGYKFSIIFLKQMTVCSNLKNMVFLWFIMVSCFQFNRDKIFVLFNNIIRFSSYFIFF